MYGKIFLIGMLVLLLGPGLEKAAMAQRGERAALRSGPAVFGGSGGVARRSEQRFQDRQVFRERGDVRPESSREGREPAAGRERLGNGERDRVADRLRLQEEGMERIHADRSSGI